MAADSRKTTSERGPAENSDLEIDQEKAQSKQGLLSRARILEPVTGEYGDLALLACSFVTGLVDAAVFSNWQCFVGMQTGNTVILGLSTAGLPANPHAWLTTLVSIFSFLIGAFLTFRTSTFVAPGGPTATRLWTGSLFFIQGLFIVIAAALAQAPGLIPQNPPNTTPETRDNAAVIDNVLIVALLPVLGIQSGMQIATSRLLGYNELPVNVLTSTYCDLMGDPKLHVGRNVKRNRRAVSAILLLAGAISSGWLLRSSGGLPSVLWISAGIKMLSGVGLWIFMPAAGSM